MRLGVLLTMSRGPGLAWLVYRPEAIPVAGRELENGPLNAGANWQQHQAALAAGNAHDVDQFVQHKS